MYNPAPYLPKRFQRFINSLKARKIPPRVVFFTIGILATTWFLIRVIPKPSRASYPCMQATAPFMSGFVLYLLSMGGAVAAFKRSGFFWRRSNYSLGILFLLLAGGFYLISQVSLPVASKAGANWSGRSYFVPNDPIGEAKGIFPGRVVWNWNPKATNENCSNISNGNGVIDPGDNIWFMAKNNNHLTIDSMVTRSLMALTGGADNATAWDLVFRFFNNGHGKGNVGYSAGERIFIKVNATSAYGGVSGGRYYADLSRNDISAVNSFASETNPYMVLSILRQLVHVVQVPENLIYVGDPARNIYKEVYDLWHNEFPEVHVLGNNLLHPELNIVSLGRTPVEVTSSDKVFFSDHGAAMPDAITDKLFTIFEEMDYLINIPTMKAHATGGITVAAKNHFGSFTRPWAMHLHPGLMAGIDDPQRLGYGLYRIQTDIMMHNLLSGKNLLIAVDALYPGEDALAVPDKWSSIPFENDWCSSIFMSLDPVAIESVCHDFLRTEYNGPTIPESRPNWFGVDDYLHQAADSANWPDGITYDPDNDGVLFASLGVHEHWNDSLHKAYTRNLGTGEGIELFKVHEQGIGIAVLPEGTVFSVYPNPTTGIVNIANQGNQPAEFHIADANGRAVQNGVVKGKSVFSLNLAHQENGIYILRLIEQNDKTDIKIIKQGLK